MKIKSFATYGVGMDIIYEDILSTGAIADLRIKSEDEKSPELYDAWKRMEARVLEYLGKLCQLDTQCMLNVSKIQLRYARKTDELESLVFSGSLMAPEAGIGFKTGAIRVNTLFDVMDTKDIGILRELEARIRGYIRGERAQAKFDFSLKDESMNKVCELKKDINECDAVHNPKHYKLKGLDIESVDVIRATLTEEEFKGWCKGNALKYLLRAGKKDDEIQDLAKGVVYINWVTEGRSHS